jgi:hypothetical protein
MDKAKRDHYEDCGNEVLARLATLILWRKRHGIDSAARLAGLWRV